MKQLQFYNLFQMMQIEDISSNGINPKAKESVKSESKALTALGQNAINELRLSVDMSNRQDVEELSVLLVELLSYPNNDMAEVHSNAMRLGNFDLQKPLSARNNRNDTSSAIIDEKQSQVMCPCCGFVKQVGTIDVTTSFDEIKNMGVSTYLYFSTYKKMAILLLILTVIYSAYALITNYLASKDGTLSNKQTSVDYISISLSSKETNDNSTNRRYYFIQCWLGIANIIVWIFSLAGMKYSQVKNIGEYDNDTISCSDYSLVMEGMPLDVTKDQLQKQLDVFYEGLNPQTIPAKWRRPFKVAKLNVGKPFYLHEESFKDEQIKNIDNELEQIKQKLIELVLQRKSSNTFKLSKNERNALYERFRNMSKKKVQKLQEIATNIKQSLKEQSGDDITTVFVTFQSNISRSYLEQLHEPSILGRIRAICGKAQDKFWYEKQGKLYQLDIRRAPEPEDIIWTNLGLRDCSVYLKKLFTFTITLILLGICFAIVFGLSRAQQNAGGSRPISIAISLTISIVNMMLGQIIRRLTIYEKDYTETYRQASLLIKSVIAQMINTILIPIITAYYVKNRNFYYENGLVDNIFMLSITTIIIPPLVLIINPYRIAMGIYRCYMSSTKNKLTLTQKEYNVLQQGVEFEVGYQSIYPVSTFMFVCFYVSLQPVISVVAMLGCFLMYWVEKYSMFDRYRRPVPGMDFVNNAVFRMICFGPIVYSFGSLTWSNFSPNGIPPEAIVPNLIALAIGVFLFSLPFNSIIIGLCLKETTTKPTNFADERIFMPSEYDRVNPSTQAEGFEQYKRYMEKKKEEIKNLGKEQQEQFAKKMAINAQRGQMMNQTNQQGGMFPGGGYNYFQPQPMVMVPGYSPYAAPMPSYMAFQQYNPMASFGFAGVGYAQPVMGMMQPRPAIMNVPPPQQVQMPVARPVQTQVNQGLNNYPSSYNSINSFAQPNQIGLNHGSPPAVVNPFGQIFNQNQGYPQQNNKPFQSQAYNPFGNGNNGINGFGPQQGRPW